MATSRALPVEFEAVREEFAAAFGTSIAAYHPDHSWHGVIRQPSTLEGYYGHCAEVAEAILSSREAQAREFAEKAAAKAESRRSADRFRKWLRRHPNASGLEVFLYGAGKRLLPGRHADGGRFTAPIGGRPRIA